MAQDIRQDFTARAWTHGLFGADITATNSVLSAALDFGAIAPLGALLNFVINMGAGTPAGNKKCVVTVAWGNSAADIDDSSNEEVVGQFNIGTASATFKKTLRLAVKARHCKVRVKNDQTSGPNILNTSTLALGDVAIDQV